MIDVGCGPCPIPYPRICMSCAQFRGPGSDTNPRILVQAKNSNKKQSKCTKTQGFVSRSSAPHKKPTSPLRHTRTLTSRAIYPPLSNPRLLRSLTRSRGHYKCPGAHHSLGARWAMPSCLEAWSSKSNKHEIYWLDKEWSAQEMRNQLTSTLTCSPFKFPSIPSPNLAWRSKEGVRRAPECLGMRQVSSSRGQ
jgi:hypothetical protein